MTTSGKERLEAIKNGFATSIQANFTSLEWADEFQEYLTLKYDVSQKDRIWFIKMFYHSIGQDLNLSRIFIRNCVQAFGKRRDIDDDCGLSLDWRILYNLVQNILEGKVSNSEVALQLLPHLLRLVDCSSRFFDPKDTIEIMERIVPDMNLTSMKRYVEQIAKLSYFLPVRNSDTEWLPLIFTWWQMAGNSAEMDTYYLYLMSRIVLGQNDPTKINWTQENMEHIFTVALKLFELEIGEAPLKDDSPNLFDRETVQMENGDYTHTSDLPECFFPNHWQSLGTLIAMHLFEEETPVSVLGPLEKLLIAIEPFCHPSNHGYWTLHIFQFMFHLAWAMLYRKNTQKGEKYLLTQSLMDRVCKMVLPLLEFGMYGKADQAIDQSHSAMKCWAWMCPNIVFPAVLPVVYDSLENLTETHRTEASIALMNLLVNPMIRPGHYESGGKELLRLLELSLPGININDERKTFMTCYMFIYSLCSVPIADSSRFANEFQGVAQEICLSTSKFEGIVEGLIESIFTCFRNLPETTSAIPTSTVRALGMLCEFILPQLSPQMEDLALQKMQPFMDTVIPYAIDAIALICGAWSGKNPKKRLDAFFMLCKKNIIEELSHGACSKQGNNPSNPSGMALLSDARFHWYQEILLRLMAYAGKDLLIYKNDIVDVFDRMLDGCISVTGYNSFASCFCNFVHSLVEKYPIGFSSHATKYWYDETFLREAHLHWGEKVDKNNLDIDWHITTLEESEFAWEVVKKYSDRSIQELSTLMMLPTDTDVQKQETYHQVSKWIVILQSCICSCLLMVKPIRYDLPTASAYSYIFSTPDVECAWAVDENHPLYNEIYANIEQMYRLLKKVLEYLLAKTPDNTDSLFNMITAIEASVTFKYYLQQELVIVKSMKPLQMIPADGTVFCRPIRMSESYALLLKRKYYSRRQGGICPARMDLIHSLLKLSVCQYTEVRKYAQTSLSRCIGDYLYLCKPITDEIVILLETLTDHDALKGCLFVLQNTAILEFLSLTRDHYYKVSLALIRLRNQTGLKDAIFELIDSLLQSIAQRLDFSTDDIVIPEIIKEEAKLIEVDLGTVGILERYREERVKLLETLLSDYVTNLVEIANTDIHWSIAVHIGYLFFLMIQAKRPIPAGIAEFAFRNLNNEHLQIRDQSMVLCNEIFTVMKRRSKLLGEFRGNEIKKVMDPASKEFQSIDLLWHKNREPIFIDKTLPGWIIYSNPTKVFTGFIDGQPYTDSESADVFPIFERYLTDDDFWNDFFRLASLETDAEEPEFNYDIAQFLTGIFTLYQTKYLEKVIPHLRILLNKTTEVASQKSCAETICGIFFGSKHFPKHQKEILVKQLLPLLSQGIVESSIEGLYFWKEAISALFSTGRDPKRYLDLVELLQLELEKYDASLSYIRQTKKVSFVNIILSSPQVPKEFYEKCLSLYLGMGTNPYQQVRESLGSGIDFALTGLSRPYDPNYATVEKLFHRKDWTSLPNRIILDFLDHNLVENIPIPGKQFNILSWFFHGLTSFAKTGFLPYYSKLVSYTIQVSESAQADVQEMANAIIKVFPKYVLPKEMVSGMIDQFCKYGTLDVSWHVKIKIINIIQVFYYFHMQFLTCNDEQQILDSLLELIQDAHLEVRKSATETLAGILRCSLRNEIPVLKEKYINLLQNTPRMIKKRSDRTIEDNNLVLKRHSYILILSSIILAFPYELPGWMPKILVSLAECHHDPSPIPETIKKTFREFKRTHQDSWERQKHVFSDDELYVITDLLISPGYYA